MSLEEKIDGMLLRRCKSTLQGCILRIAGAAARRLLTLNLVNSEKIGLIGENSQLWFEVADGISSGSIVLIRRGDITVSPEQLPVIDSIPNKYLTKDCLETAILNHIEELAYNPFI